MKNYFYFTLCIVLFACGQSAQEKAAYQKKHDDSVAQVAANNAQQEQKKIDEANAKAQKEREIASTNLKVYQQQLEIAIADLSAANTKMTEIKSEDCWLQSCKDAKVRNVKNQTLVIEHLQDEIKTYQDKINKANALLNQ